MAIVNGPAHSEEATGSVAGVSYSYEGSSTNARARVTPNNVRSPSQGEYRRRVFNRASFEYSNLSIPIFETWLLDSETRIIQNKLGKPYQARPRIIFMKRVLSQLLGENPNVVVGKAGHSASYLPDLELIWTGSGAQLSWSEPITGSGLIFVKQWRNLLLTQHRWQKFIISHIFTSDYSSPQLLTPALGGGSGPGNLPPLTAGTFQVFIVQCFDSNAFGSPKRTFRIQSL